MEVYIKKSIKIILKDGTGYQLIKEEQERKKNV